MRKSVALTILAMVTACAFAASKDSGSTTLKDVQPVGVTDKKHKHQQFDLSFDTPVGREYTCRTPEKTSVKATDFIVGSSIRYQVDGDKGKVKGANGKQLSCTIVRVANVSGVPK